jgi:N-acetylmuramoyl-L-alanine amidase
VTGTGLDTASSVIIGKNVVPAADWRVDSSTQLTILAAPEVQMTGPAEVIIQNYWNRSPATVAGLYVYQDGTPRLPGSRVVDEAIKNVGVPYLWAGASPTSGFDCSGLTMYAYQKIGISLPHYSRAQAGYGTPVSQDALLPGDLVFFSDPISHVGIYVGNGLMINAPRSGDLVTIENLYRSSYNTARRLISPYTRYADNDYRLTTIGAWGTSSTSSAAGGSFRYLNSSGLMTVKFNGTYLAWITKVAPQYGKARVTVDGGDPVTVDLYNSTTQYQKKVWDTGMLDPGLHTLTIEWTGTKNSAATSYYVGVDSFDLLGELVQAPGPARYPQSDSRIAYEGSWATWYSTSAYGGSFYYSLSPAKATIAFDGTYLAWIAQKGPLNGKAKVILDGGDPQTVDLYDSSYVSKQAVYNTGVLDDGPHTVSIEWTGTRNTAATMDLVNLDAVEVVGELTDANLLSPGLSITRHEQTDPLLAYEGEWSKWYTSSASGGSVDYADSAGKAEIAFDGTYLAWIAQKGPVYGKALVTLDEGAAETVDLYSSSYLGKQTVYRTAMLADGPHTLTIEWTGTKNSAASLDLVNLDVVEVVGELTDANDGTPGTTVTRYEQSDPRIGYLGYWNAASYVAASGGSFAYSSGQSTVVVGFEGTSLDWLTEKSKYYGIAKVRLDGGAETQVDLYSGTTLYQQRVYSTGELEDTTHTLTIEWTGSANAAAAGTSIGVDAFDIAGELTQAPGLTHYEENTGGIAYAGSWAPNSWAVPASAGRSVVTNTPGSSVTVSFDGTYIGWVTKKSPYYGHAMVFLDDAAPVTVDLYHSSEIWQQRVWNSGVLDAGRHTLTIQWSFGRNKAALGTYLSIDAFDVSGTLAQATPTVKHPEPKVVVIDPGHQAEANYGLEPVGPGSSTMKVKVSAGTASVNTGSPESELNLALGLKLRDVLQSYGIQVVMTRVSEAVDISNAQRAQMANAAGGDLFVRIHADGATDPAVNGVLVLYPSSISGWTDDIAAESVRSATIALQELTAATGAKSRGLSARSDIAGFNWSDIPVFLAEVGVMTNPAEDALLATEAYRDKIVSGLADTVLCFLDFY